MKLSKIGRSHQITKLKVRTGKVLTCFLVVFVVVLCTEPGHSKSQD